MAEDILDTLEDEDSFFDTLEDDDAFFDTLEEEATTLTGALFQSSVSGEPKPLTDPKGDPIIHQGQMIRLPEKEGGTMGGINELVNVVDASRKLLGATISPGGKGFISALQDPNVGALRRLKEMVDNQDTPGIVKFVQKFGLEIIEDPTTWVFGLLGAAKKGTKALIDRVAKTTQKIGAERAIQAKKGLQLAPEVIEESGLGGLKESGKKGLSDVTGKVDDITATPLERASLETVEDIDKPFIQSASKREIPLREKEIALKEDIPGGFGAGRQVRDSEVVKRLDDLRIKHKLSDEPGVTFAKESADRMAFAESRYQKEAGKIWDDIAKRADDAGFVPKSSIETFRGQLSKMGILPKAAKKVKAPMTIGEKIGITTREEATKNIKKLFDAGFKGEGTIDDFLRQVDPSDVTKVEKVVKPTARGARITPRLFNALEDFSADLTDGANFARLWEMRKLLHQLKKEAYSGNFGKEFLNQKKVIKEMTDTVNKIMERRLIRRSPGLVDEWRKMNKSFAFNKEAFKELKPLIMTTQGANVGKAHDASTIIKNIEKIKPERLGNIISRLGDDFFGEAIVPLRNIYFNKLLNGVIKGDKIDANKLLKNLDEADASTFNAVLTDDMANDLADLVQRAITTKYANEINLLDKSAKPLQEGLKRAGQGMEWFLRFRMGKGFGISSLIAGSLGRSFFKEALRQRSVKNIQQFLRPTDDINKLPIVLKNLFGSTLEGVKAGPGVAAKAGTGFGAVREATQSIGSSQQ